MTEHLRQNTRRLMWKYRVLPLAVAVAVGIGMTATVDARPGKPRPPHPHKTALPTATPPATPAPTPVGATPTAQPTATPPAGTQLTYVPTPNVPRPGYRQSVIDVNFGTTITRISGTDGLPGSGTPSRHAYAKNQPWSADGELVILHFQKPSPVLDATTWSLVRYADVHGDFRWSNTEPLRMYGFTGGTARFESVTPATSDGRTLVHTFPANISSLGGGEGNQSNDDRYWPIFTAGTIYVYDKATDTVVGSRPFSPMPDNATMSPSGQYIVLNFEGIADPNGGGVQVWSRDLTTFHRRLVGTGLHGDVGYDTSGNEVWVQASHDQGPGGLVPMYRLADGARTDLFPAASFPQGTAYWASHVSTRNIDRPGWVYLSYYFTPETRPGNDEVVALRMDGSGLVQRFGHQHHTTFPNYPMEPMAVPSRDGTQVMFASEWGTAAPASFVSTP